MLNLFQYLFKRDSEINSEWQKDNNHKRLFINPTVMLNSFQHLFLLNSEINSEWLYTRLLRRFAVKEMLRNKLNKLNLLQKRKNHLFKWRVWKIIGKIIGKNYILNLAIVCVSTHNYLTTQLWEQFEGSFNVFFCYWLQCFHFLFNRISFSL